MKTSKRGDHGPPWLPSSALGCLNDCYLLSAFTAVSNAALCCCS